MDYKRSENVDNQWWSCQLVIISELFNSFLLIISSTSGILCWLEQTQIQKLQLQRLSQDSLLIEILQVLLPVER